MCIRDSDYFLYGLPSHVAGEQKTALKHLLDYAKKDPKKREELAMFLVVELHNRSQEAINAYLEADANELAQRQFKDLAVEYVHYPRMLQAAILDVYKRQVPLHQRMNRAQRLFFCQPVIQLTGRAAGLAPFPKVGGQEILVANSC